MRLKAAKFVSARGFTLMEMLVALSVFSILVVAASDVFILASRAQRKALNMEALQTSARYSMEAMVREVRMGTLDYAYYAERNAEAETTGPLLGIPETDLAVTDRDGVRMVFFRSDIEVQDGSAQYCPDPTSVPCLLVKVGDEVTPAPLSPKGVRVRDAKFYLYPEKDPMTFDFASSGYLINGQPAVTILLSLESTVGRAGEMDQFYLQTTAVSRAYKR